MSFSNTLDLLNINLIIFFRLRKSLPIESAKKDVNAYIKMTEYVDFALSDLVYSSYQNDLIEPPFGISMIFVCFHFNILRHQLLVKMAFEKNVKNSSDLKLTRSLKAKSTYSVILM